MASLAHTGRVQFECHLPRERSHGARVKALAIPTLFFLTQLACVEVDLDLNLKSTGAGILGLDVRILPAAAAMMFDGPNDPEWREMAETFESSDGAFPAHIDRVRVKEKHSEKKGFSLDVNAWFSQPLGLFNRPSGDGEAPMFQLEAIGDRTYRITPGDLGMGSPFGDMPGSVGDLLSGGDDTTDAPAEADGTPIDDLDFAALSAMMAEMQKARLSLSLTLPGEVLSAEPANLATIRGKKVSWTLDANSLMNGDPSQTMDAFSVTFKTKAPLSFQ